MKSAVTVSLVAEAKGGPFVFWDDLPAACRHAKELGFDAIELFAPGPDAVSKDELASLLKSHGLGLAAVGTGAGWVKHKLALTSADAAIRQKAIAFVKSMIDFGGPHRAPAIIGSMQGRWGEGVSKEQALDWLKAALNELGEHARQYGVPLIYEPLNRYETNLITTEAAGAEYMQSLQTDNVRLLADLFHMNIEETNIATGLTDGVAGSGMSTLSTRTVDRPDAGIWITVPSSRRCDQSTIRAICRPRRCRGRTQSLRRGRRLRCIENLLDKRKSRFECRIKKANHDVEMHDAGTDSQFWIW